MENQRINNLDLTLEELEQYRDQNGFIDLTPLNLSLNKTNHEIRGNQDRFKNWFQLKDTRVLLREELIFDNEQNYGIYSELIMEELLKQAGIPHAHYDLIKIGDKSGVLSQDVRQSYDDEYIVSLREIIGDENEADSINPLVTTYSFTEQGIKDYFSSQEHLSEEEISKIITEYRKRTAFSLMTIDEDKHTENISFIKNTRTGKMTLSPVYDNENALLLTTSKELTPKLLADYDTLTKSAIMTCPRIAENGFNSDYTLDTIDYIAYDNKEVFDYIQHTLANLDIEKAIQDVETRIHAKIPDDAKDIAKYAFMFNQTRIPAYIDKEIGEPDDPSFEDDLDFDDVFESTTNPLFRLTELLKASVSNKGITTDELTESTKSFTDDVEMYLERTGQKKPTPVQDTSSKAEISPADLKNYFEGKKSASAHTDTSHNNDHDDHDELY